MWLIWLLFTCFVRLLVGLAKQSNIWNWNELNLENHFTWKLREAAKCSNMILQHDVGLCCALLLKFRRYVAHFTIYENVSSFSRGLRPLRACSVSNVNDDTTNVIHVRCPRLIDNVWEEQSGAIDKLTNSVVITISTFLLTFICLFFIVI